eukprot:SAG22_NODE_14033_length_387_cov_0.739583_1_plen_69_part_01
MDLLMGGAMGDGGVGGGGGGGGAKAAAEALKVKDQQFVGLLEKIAAIMKDGATLTARFEAAAGVGGSGG